MRNKRVLFMTQAAMIAAMYVVLTMFISAFDLASGAIQVRISEALCILPVFMPAAVPGLWIGCLLANMLTPNVMVFDIVFGSLATLIGAVGTYLLRRHPFLCTLPPVVSNAVIIPLVLRFGYGYTFFYKGVDLSVPFFAVTVGIGEILSVCVFGSLLLRVLERYRNVIFRQSGTGWKSKRVKETVYEKDDRPHYGGSDQSV